MVTLTKLKFSFPHFLHFNFILILLCFDDLIISFSTKKSSIFSRARWLPRNWFIFQKPLDFLLPLCYTEVTRAGLVTPWVCVDRYAVPWLAVFSYALMYSRKADRCRSDSAVLVSVLLLRRRNHCPGCCSGNVPAHFSPISHRGRCVAVPQTNAQHKQTG